MNALSRPPIHWPPPCTIVTGASSGLGWELALQLAQAGVPVVAIGRDAARLKALAALNPRIATLVADLAAVDGLPKVVSELLERHPDVGCLINNAGVQRDVRADDAAEGLAEIRAEVDINLVAPMVLTRLLLPHLLARPGAVVVNVTSSLAYLPKRTAAVYSATKAGLRLYTDGLRVQMLGRPLRIVEVVLPLVDTPMTAGRGAGKVPAAQAARHILAGMRLGTPRICVGKAGLLLTLVRWLPGVAARLLQRT